MLRNTTNIQADGARQVVTSAVLIKVCTSGYVDLHHVRNLSLISNTLGAHNSMVVNGEWCMIYDQTALGMDYLDCS